MTTLMLAMLTPAPGKEDEFNRWYDETHAAEALATPGLSSIVRYKMAEVVLYPGIEFSAPYLTLREVFLGGEDTEGRHISEVRFSDLVDMRDLAAGFAVEVAARRTKAEVLGVADGGAIGRSAGDA